MRQEIERKSHRRELSQEIETRQVGQTRQVGPTPSPNRLERKQPEGDISVLRLAHIAGRNRQLVLLVRKEGAQREEEVPVSNRRHPAIGDVGDVHRCTQEDADRLKTRQRISKGEAPARLRDATASFSTKKCMGKLIPRARSSQPGWIPFAPDTILTVSPHSTPLSFPFFYSFQKISK